LSATITDVADVHPLSGSVTTRLYCPETPMIKVEVSAVNPFGPTQEYVALVSRVFPSTVERSSTQVSASAVAVAPGPSVLTMTVAVAVLEQPVMVSFTTTLYVPEVSTAGLCSVEVYPFGPVQTKVGLPELVEVLNTIVSATHVSEPPVVERLGGVLYPVTLVVEVLVQPFVVFVTIKVYTAGAPTTGLSVFPPETMVPPVQE